MVSEECFVRVASPGRFLRGQDQALFARLSDTLPKRFTEIKKIDLVTFINGKKSISTKYMYKVYPKASKRSKVVNKNYRNMQMNRCLC